MCTINNLKPLIEENTWSILFIVIQHLIYAKSLIFFTVSQVNLTQSVWENLAFFPQMSEKYFIPISYEKQEWIREWLKFWN